MATESIFIRSSKNPVFKPNPSIPWMSKKVYNPAAIFYKGKYHLFFRAVGDDWVSRIGHAISEDGEKFEIEKEPLFEISGATESRGHEDPRVTKVGLRFVMVFSVYDGVSVRLHTAWSKDLYTWERKGVAFENFNFIEAGGRFASFDSEGNFKESISSPKGALACIRAKSGAIFPQKIKGSYLMLFGEYQMWLATSKDEVIWNAGKKPFLHKRGKNYFDNAFIEMGAPPIKIPEGWLVIYHGVNKKHAYSAGYLILDKNDPSKIIYRSTKPIFSSQTEYEKKGLVDVIPNSSKIDFKQLTQTDLEEFIEKAIKKGIMPEVVFVCGAIKRGNLLRIYYGASDTWICTATAKISDILAPFNNSRKKVLSDAKNCLKI